MLGQYTTHVNCWFIAPIYVKIVGGLLLFYIHYSFCGAIWGVQFYGDGISWYILHFTKQQFTADYVDVNPS